jgi:hypothetical protein
VNYTHPVDLFQAGYDLMEKAASLSLSNASACDNVIEEFTATAILHDEIQLLRRLNDFVKLDDMWMLNQLQDMNLSCDTLYIGYIHDALLF